MNVIYCGDNLEVLSKYIPDDSIDLCYIDPPFNSSRNYEVFWGEAQEKRAFEDRFGDAMAYVEWMRPRLREIHRVLKPSGHFFYHCDWHASHYVKVELDRIFDFSNFQNEIIWYYRGAGVSKKRFGRRHDTILWYTKSARAGWYFDPDPARQPYASATVERFSHYIGNKRDGHDFGVQILNPKGKHPDDVWTDIQPIAPSANDRLGYPTQKPLELLERIVLTASSEDAIILDAFCGCGTTLEAAAKHKRHWIGIDLSPTACRVMAERLETRLNLMEGFHFWLKDMPKTAEQLRKMPPFEFQNWAVTALGGIPNKVKVGDRGIDGRLYLADIEKPHKGDFYESLDIWYPIQVKQMDKVGRPDIDGFETAMRRDKRLRGYFVAFGFSQDAVKEIKRANKSDGLDIVPVTVQEILIHQKTVSTSTLQPALFS